MTTHIRLMLLNEMRKNGMSQSPLSAKKVTRTLERLDANGKRDVHVYNVLLEIALYRKEVGPRDAFLDEMEAHGVLPNADTLAMLLRTVSTAEDVSAMEGLVQRFRQKYRVKLTAKPALVLLQRYAEAGNAEQALRVFQAVRSLSDRPEAWSGLVTAHIKRGEVSQAAALLRSMNDKAGLRPDVSLFNAALAAGAAKKDGSVEPVLQLMRRLRIQPSLETVDALGSLAVGKRV